MEKVGSIPHSKQGSTNVWLSNDVYHHAAAGTSKLLQVAEYSLYGCVQSMEKVRLLHSKRDTLLLSFNDAKVGELLLPVCDHVFNPLPLLFLLLSLVVCCRI